MTADIRPPPEAQLITELRKKPPRMSMRQAAADVGISPTHWRQVETGVRRFRGQDWQETGTAYTIARMALVVGAAPEQLAGAGRDDAARELAALLEAVRSLLSKPELTERQRRRMAARWLRDASDG